MGYLEGPTITEETDTGVLTRTLSACIVVQRDDPLPLTVRASDTQKGDKLTSTDLACILEQTLFPGPGLVRLVNVVHELTLEMLDLITGIVLWASSRRFPAH